MLGGEQNPAREFPQWQPQRKSVPKCQILSLTTKQSLSLLITQKRWQKPHWPAQASKGLQLWGFSSRRQHPKVKSNQTLGLTVPGSNSASLANCCSGLLRSVPYTSPQGYVTVLIHNTVCTKIHKRETPNTFSKFTCSDLLENDKGFPSQQSSQPHRV